MMDSPITFTGFPFIFGWELTLACNLQCKHCGSSAGIPRQNELTTEEALGLCDQLSEMLVQEVDFTGGEPLLRKDWPLIAQRLRDHGVMVKIVTNGTMLDEHTAALLKEAEVTGVGVSIDGLEPTHDFVRGREGLFRNVMGAIHKALKVDLSITVITSVNSLNLPELPKMMEYFVEAGVQNWRLQPVFPSGRAGAGRQIHLTEKDFLDFGAFVSEWESRALKAGIVMRTGDAYGYFTEFDQCDPPWRGCPAGLFSCGVTSDGKIKGCLSMSDSLVEGDLRRHTLWDIWFNPHSFKFNRDASAMKMGPLCSDCSHAEQCLGGCSAMSYASTGLFHNDPFCFHGIQTRSPNPHKGCTQNSQKVER